MNTTDLALVILVATGFLVVAIFLGVQSFGSLVREYRESNEKTRLACEATAERVQDTERRIADRDARSIELVRDMMKSTTYGSS